MGRPRRIVIGPAVLLFALGMGLTVGRMLGATLQTMPGESCDSRFSSFILEHGALFLAGKTPSYWSAPFLYPLAATISFSDNFLATLPLYALLRPLVADRETAYQLWFAGLFALNYWLSRYAALRLGLGPFAAALTAYVCAFSLPIMEEVAHPAMLHLFMVPIVYAFTALYFSEGKIRHLYAAGLALVVQFYCSFYVAALLGLGLACFGVVCCLQYRAAARELFLTRRIIWAAALVLVMAGLLAPLLTPYLKTAARYGLRRFPEGVMEQLPQAAYYLSASRASLLWGFSAALAPQADVANKLFPGLLPVCAFVLFPFLAWRGNAPFRRLGWALWLTVVFLAAVTLRIGDRSAYTLVMLVPPFDSLRALTRIGLLLVFPLALLLGVVLTRLLTRLPRLLGRLPRGRQGPAGGLVCLILAGAVVVDQVHGREYGYDKAASQGQVAALTRRLRDAGRDFTAFVHIPDPAGAVYDCAMQVNALLAAQDLGVATVNAYTSWFPPGYGLFADCSFDALQQWVYWSWFDRDNAVDPARAFDNLLVLSDAGPVPPGLHLRWEGLREHLLDRYFADPAGQTGLLHFLLDMRGFYPMPGGLAWMGRQGELATEANERFTATVVSPAATTLTLWRDDRVERTVELAPMEPLIISGGGARPARYRIASSRVYAGNSQDPRPRHYPVSLQVTALVFSRGEAVLDAKQPAPTP